MRGRRPSGPEYVERLGGSAAAKERLRVVLETLAGHCRVAEACARLGLSEPRFHQLRARLLQAALEGLEPRPAGRPRRAEADARVQELQATIADLRVELRAAQVHEEIALVLPHRAEAAAAPGKKTTRRRQRRRRRRAPDT